METTHTEISTESTEGAPEVVVEVAAEFAAASATPSVDAAAEEKEGRRLAEEYGLEFVDLRNFRIQNDLFRRVPFDLMLRYSFIPEAMKGGRMDVVMADPTDVRRIDELERLLGHAVEVKVGAPSAIEAILQKSESSSPHPSAGPVKWD